MSIALTAGLWVVPANADEIEPPNADAPAALSSTGDSPPASVPGDEQTATGTAQNAGDPTSAQALAADHADNELWIKEQPTNVSVREGEEAKFTIVAAYGQNIGDHAFGLLFYTWYVSSDHGQTWSMAPGGVASNYYPNYEIERASSDQDGNLYRVEVVDRWGGGLTSNEVELAVGDPPTIVEQPAHVFVDQGSPAVLKVRATGTGTLKYEWFCSHDNRATWVPADGISASNGDYNTFTTPPQSNARQVDYYRVIVTSRYGQATSNSVEFHVFNWTPDITQQPTGATVLAGDSATFSVSASTEKGSLRYRWYSASKGSDTWHLQRDFQSIKRTGSDSLSVGPTTPEMDGTRYRVDISTDLAQTTSETVTLHVATAPTITSQPTDVTVVEGKTATFSVRATGSGQLTYQWEWARQGSNSWSKETSGASSTTSTLTTGARELSFDGFRYRVVVTSEFGSVTSKEVTLHVVKATKITTQPVDVTVPDQGAATFSVVASGPDGLKYFWERSTDGGVTWTSVSVSGGAGCGYASTCRFGKVTMDDDQSLFRVVVKSEYESVTSATATLTVVGNSPRLALEPGDQLAAAGSTVTFKSLGDGTGPLTYQWQKRVAGSLEWIDLPGETSRDLTVRSVSSSDNGDHYSVVITSPYGRAVSRAARLSVVSVAGVEMTVTAKVIRVDHL